MHKGNQYPLIQITIDLGQNKSDQLILYRHTDPYQEASAFIQRNNLQPKMIQIISNSIIKQMKAYDEMMIITYDTQQETNYLRNLKQNHLELQQKLKTPSPNRQKKTNTQNLKMSKSPSQAQVHDDLPTDKVIIKKLFKLLDGDYDGLIQPNQGFIIYFINTQQILNQLIRIKNRYHIFIYCLTLSAQRINFYNIPIQLQNKVQNKIEKLSIPLEFEDFYLKLKEDPQDEYFQTLKLISQIFYIPRIKVLI